MVVEIPIELEPALQFQAKALGISPEAFVRESLKRSLASSDVTGLKPLKTGYGMFDHQLNLSAEEIDANSRDVWQSFGEAF